MNAATGKPTPLSNMLAGACAGIAESVTVLTPGENLKTKLIDGRANGVSISQLSTTRLFSRILAEEGVSGLYRGVVPVAMKQSANAVVRFTSYQYLLEMTKSSLEGRGVRSAVIAPAAAGGLAGIITVYITMPFDNVKTKLQAFEGGTAYRGSLHCLREIVRRNGVIDLWKGTTPRLVRLSVSGILSFSIYEQMMELTRKVRREQDLRIVGVAW